MSSPEQAIAYWFNHWALLSPYYSIISPQPSPELVHVNDHADFPNAELDFSSDDEMPDALSCTLSRPFITNSQKHAVGATRRASASST